MTKATFRIRPLSEEDAIRLRKELGDGPHDLEVIYSGKRMTMPGCKMDHIPSWADADCLDPELIAGLEMKERE